MSGMLSILKKIGLDRLLKRKTEVKTVRLDIIAEQVKQFNEAKKEMTNRIDHLEEKAVEIDKTLEATLDISKHNQERLTSMEENMNKILALSEGLLKKELKEKTGKDLPTETIKEEEAEGIAESS